MRSLAYLIVSGILFIGIMTIIAKIEVAIAIRAIKDEFFENNYLQFYKDRTIKDQHREEWELWKQEREYEEFLQWKREKENTTK